MTFDEKVEFLRILPQFKVIQLTELKAVAFATVEKSQSDKNDVVIGKLSDSILLVLTMDDVQKIVREYPDLEAKLIP